MSQVHTQYVFCKHKDMLGMSPADQGKVLVTLSKDGVLLYERSEQKQIQTWTLGGSATRKMIATSVCFSTQGLGAYDYAGIVQERSKKYLALWNSECASVSEGRKIAIKHTNNIKILPVENMVGIAQGFLVYSCDNALSFVHFPSDDSEGELVSIENEHIPAKAKVLKVDLVLQKDCVVLAYLCKDKSGLDLSIVKLSMSQSKDGSGSKCELDVELIARKAFGKKASKPISMDIQDHEIYFARDNLAVDIFELDKVEAQPNTFEFKQIGESNPGECACIALSSEQFATALVREVENVRVVCVAIIDKEYGYPLDVFYDKDMPVASGEEVLGMDYYDEETFFVLTKSSAYCFKISIKEESFGSMLGCYAKGSSRSSLFVKEDIKANTTTSEVLLADIQQRVPSKEYCYEICESIKPERLVSNNHEVLSNLKSWISKHKFKTAKEIVNEILSVMKSSLQDLSDGFIADLWDYIIEDQYWKGLSRLAKRNIIPCHSKIPQVLQNLLEKKEYDLFQMLLRKSNLLSTADTHLMLEAILKHEMTSSNARSALLCILSQNPNVEVITRAVKKLNLGQVRVILESLLITIKQASDSNESTSANRKTLKAAITSVTCIIDAHLSGLLLSEDSHQVIEQLQHFVQKELSHEKSIDRLVNYMRDLDSIEPIKQQDSYKPQDFAVELLNISVE